MVNRMDRRKQEVRDRILGAAFDLFLERGVSRRPSRTFASAPTSQTARSSTTSPAGTT